MAPPVTDPFTITNGFAGTYQTAGGSSYYLNGDPNADAIHFSVRDPNDISAFHITYPLTGSNIGIWYNNGAFSSVNRRNIPSYKLNAWNTWWAANRDNCHAAATDFYNQFH